jgi:tetratricopeptide (TPR) repeat protein
MFVNRFNAIARIAGGVGRLSLCLILLGIPGLRAMPQSQSASRESHVLPPLKAGLLAVHEPEMENLEAEIRQQLVAVRTSWPALAKNKSIDDAGLSEVYGLLGQLYQAYAMARPAEECYLNAQRLAAQDFRWVYLLGTIYQQEGRTEEALKSYQQARQLRPDYVAVPVHSGNIYLRQNRLPEAAASFKEALAINAQCAAAQYGLGQVALSGRNYAEAVKYLEQALMQVPEANRIHYALAMAYRGLGNLEKAQSHLQRQGQVGVRVPDPLVDALQGLLRGERVHLLRGRLAFDAGSFSEAAEEFRKAVAAKADSLPARVNLGSALAQLGNSKEAIEQFQEALKINPENTAAHYNLGFLLAKHSQYDQAIFHLNSLLELSPKDAQGYYLLGQTLLKVQRLDAALAAFSRVVELNSDNEDALLEQVKLLLKKREYKKALQGLEKGHALFPHKGRTASTLAYLLATSPQYDLRDGNKALQLAKLVYQATGSVNHGAIVALALAELGRCGEASEWQRKMIAEAEREGNTDMVIKLKIDLQRYEKAQPCRLAGETDVGHPKQPGETKKP